MLIKPENCELCMFEGTEDCVPEPDGKRNCKNFMSIDTYINVDDDDREYEGDIYE